MRQYINLINTINNESIYPIEIFNRKYLIEMLLSDLINNTDKKRLEKAEKEVRTKPPRVVDTDDGYEKLLFNFKAFPSREKKRHKGYLIHEKGDIKELFCDCADFYYRLYDALVNAKLATYKLSDMFKYLLIKPINNVPKARPNQKLYVCKHLAALRSYI